MEEYNDLIIKINDVLNIIASTENTREKSKIFENNLTLFIDFKNSLNTILRLFQFKENGDITPNGISDNLKNIIAMLLQNKFVLENQPQFEYFASELLDSLSYNENRFAYNLQYEINMGKVETAIEYLQTRTDYLTILEENNYFQGENLNTSSALSYRSSKYEENMLGHALIQIKNNFLNMNKEDIIRIIQCIDNSGFFEKLIQKTDKQMDFYDKNLVFQYTDTILKLKSIFTPESIKDDKFVQTMWNGKIKNPKTIQNIISNVSIDNMYSLLESSSENSQNPFLLDLANHFKEVDFSDKNIALVINEILSRDNLPYEVAILLAKIDVPNNFSEFMDSEHFEEFSWLSEGTVFQTLKKSEKVIEDARRPYLPAEYYIKKLDSHADINPHFIDNLITLLDTDFFSEEEKESLKQCLDRNNLSCEQYPIPSIDYAQNTLNNFLTNKTPLEKATLQACIKSIIISSLADKGIDIHNQVFFGEGHGYNLGYFDSTNNCIWIDDSLLEKFLNSPELSQKAELFNTMFHEMHHAVQYDNITKGKINFLTYNFIKEDIIRQYDENFYNDNYQSIFSETDARKEGIIGTLEFLNGLNPQFVEVVKSPYEQSYISESENHSISQDEKKNLAIGKNGTNIDISDYIGYLIQSNPQILVNYPILSLEYNQDGTLKSLDTLLQEFEQKKSSQTTDYKNLYSIYYGLINKNISKSPVQDEALQQRIALFLQEEQSLVTMEDMQNCYCEVDKSNLSRLYSRLYNLIRANKQNSVTQEVGIDDNITI